MSAEIQFEAGVGVEVGGGGIYLHFAKSAYICGFPNFVDATFISRFHSHFADSNYSCLQLHFGTYLKICFCNPGVYRHKIVHIFSLRTVWPRKD